MKTVDVDTLNKFKERFDEIKEIRNNEIKTIRAAALMTDMENVYEIPMVGPLRIAAFNQAFPEVIDLYKRASQMRSF